jgi:Kef-type K+ transport system membrane component KefB
MVDMNDILLTLALVLAGAEIGAVLASSVRLPRAVGQIAAGLILGPSLLGVVSATPIVTSLAEIGALCILAIAGLETNRILMRRVGRAALLAAFGGVLLPFIGGMLVASATGSDLRAALFVGAILTATSVGITAAVLGELGLLRSQAGMVVLGAAVIDDVIGLVVLALVVAASGAGASSPLLTVIPMAVTLAASALAIKLLGTRAATLIGHLHLRGGGSAAAVALILAAAWAFQALGGLAGITGAYLAGFALAESPVAPSVRDRLTHAGESFCVPVFFVAIGLAADLRTVGPVLPLALALLVVAVVGKLIGSGFGARLGGLDGRSSVLVGTGMIARGEVALVAASLGLQSGAIGPGLYAAVVLIALATTVITPIGLTLWAHWATRQPESRPMVAFAAGPGESTPELGRVLAMSSYDGDAGR